MATPANTERELLVVVQNFYHWALAKGKATRKLEPKVQLVPGSVRLRLDLSNLPYFTAQFMSSGLFAHTFPVTVRRYYQAKQGELDALSLETFEIMTKDGRGSLLETENMDVYFCAQEYEYTAAFVRAMRVSSAQVSQYQAHATIISPLGWETQFRFVKVGKTWKIASYCVYQ